MAVWTGDDVSEWFGDDMDAAREHMAYERDERLTEVKRELADAHRDLEHDYSDVMDRMLILERVANLSAEALRLESPRVAPAE